MAEIDFSAEIRALRSTYASIEEVSNVEAIREDIEELSEMAGVPDLWDDPAAAQKITSKLSHRQSELERLEKLAARIDDLEVLVELAQDEADEDSRAEAAAELESLRKALTQLEVVTLLSGEYDEREAVVTIRAGAGGVDAADFAEMLLRMYLRWAGTHRLVRISPFDNQGRRQTSFAAVEVIPLIEATDHIDIPDNEIRVDVFRSSGPGGQSVNTTDSAVRLTHIPTGVVVSMQNEKSQLQNRAAAMRVLQSRLLLLKKEQEDAEKKALAGDVKASWGDQMRSYVLNPYQMVKDLRTEHEVGNTSAVFDGEIDDFIDAGIRWRAHGSIPAAK